MKTALFDTPWGTVLVAIAVGCLVLCAALVALARPRHAWLRERLGTYTDADGGSAATVSDASWKARMDAVFGATERRFDTTSAWKGVQRLLERAGMDTPAVQLLWFSVAVAVAALFVVGLLAQSFWLAIVAAVAAGFAPLAIVSAKGRRRMRAFDDQLPDILQTMSGSLQVGHSFNQSLQAIVDEGQRPAADEFARVIAEMRFGRQADEAFEDMAKRLCSPDFDYVVMSVRIQRQIGGSLANLFETVAQTVRERQQFRRKVKAITATGRASAYVLISLPFVTALLVSLVNHSYLKPLTETTTGKIMVAVSLVMIAIGAVVLRKIVDVKG